MIDERLKKYFTIVKHYNGQTHQGKRVMLERFFGAAVHTEADQRTKNLLIKFQLKESNKYVPANQDPEPPRFA